MKKILDKYILICSLIFLTKCSAHEHTWESFVVKESTHTSDGILLLQCTTCSENIIERIPKIDDHFYEINHIDSIKHIYCCECGDSYLEEHSFLKNEEKSIEPTCTRKGQLIEECSKCHFEKTTELSMLSHEFNKLNKAANNDCHYFSCVCGNAIKEDHLFPSSPNDSQEPTCTQEGFSIYKCSICNYEKRITIPKLDHEFVLDEINSVVPTCVEKGIEVLKCTNCGYIKSSNLDIVGHSYDTGTEKIEGDKTFLEFECLTCHQKCNNLVAFNTIEVDGDTATSGKFPATDGSFGTWNVSLPAGEYNVYFTAKFSSSGVNYAFSGASSRGIAVKYNDVEVEFDGSKTAEDYGLSTSEFKEFTFFKITATGGNDVLAMQNPYYRLTFDASSYIVFSPII